MNNKIIANNDDEIIENIIHSFTNYNIRDIIQINNYEHNFVIAEFILCSCLIDQLSGFRYNEKVVKKRYINFIDDYLPQYRSISLYKDIRCKLVHNYSVGKFYGITSNNNKKHLKKESNLTILNLENFIEDLVTALEKYTKELKSNEIIRENALKWYKVNKIIGITKITK